MTGRVRRLSIRQWLQVIVLVMMAFLFFLQLFVQSFFMDAMRTLYMGNVNNAIDQVVSDLRALTDAQLGAVTHIANEDDVRAYAATQDSRERYQMAYGDVRPIVRSATQNLPIDNLVVYDTSGAWYQYQGALSFEGFRTLREMFKELRDATNAMVILDGELFLCSAAPMLRVDRGGTLVQDGLVAALINERTIGHTLPRGDNLAGGTILLHNGETILMSTDTALNGQPLAEGPISYRDYYVSSETVLTNLFVTVSIPRDQIFPEQTPYLLTFSTVGLFALFALTITLHLSNRWFSRPLTRIISEMRDISVQGHRLRHTGLAHMDSIVDGVNDLLMRLEDSNREIISAQQTLYETELEQQQTQLMLLKKQINAHFLYNCLTSIKTLSDEGEAEKAGEMAQGVGLLMRYTHSVQEEVNVFDEMSIIQRYVQIMNIRFGDRFHYTFDVDDELVGYKIRKLLLQPLVENALVHGLERQSSMCHLYVTGKREGDSLMFTVEDSGVGISPEKLAEIQKTLEQVDVDYPYQRLKGISLLNIQKRVHTAYGKAYGLAIESKPGKGTRVILRVKAVPDVTA